MKLLRLFQIRDYNSWNSVLVEKRHKFEVYNDFRWNAVLRVIVRFSNLRSLFDAFLWAFIWRPYKMDRFKWFSKIKVATFLWNIIAQISKRPISKMSRYLHGMIWTNLLFGGVLLQKRFQSVSFFDCISEMWKCNVISQKSAECWKIKSFKCDQLALIFNEIFFYFSWVSIYQRSQTKSIRIHQNGRNAYFIR